MRSAGVGGLAPQQSFGARRLYAAVDDGFATAALPEFVRREFESYLDCGLLCRGLCLQAAPAGRASPASSLP